MGTKPSSNLSLPTNILFGISQNKTAVPLGDDLFHTFNIISFFKKRSLSQVTSALTNLTPLHCLKIFLDMTGVSGVKVLKNTARFPFRERKLHIEFKSAEMCLGVHSGGKNF